MHFKYGFSVLYKKNILKMHFSKLKNAFWKCVFLYKTENAYLKCTVKTIFIEIL